MATDVARVGVWRHELATGRIHFNNPSWDMLGLAPRPDGMPLDELRQFIHPDDLPGIVAAAEQALTSSEPVDAEARYRHSDGSWRHLLTRRSLQRDDNGAPQAFLGVSLDFTEHRATLALAQQAHARTQASAQLMARASHELRTPLNAVLGLARLMVDRPDAPVDQRRRLARHILSAGERLLALVDDLLELSDAQADAGPLHAVAVNLADWAWHDAQALQPLAQARGVSLQLRTGTGQVLGDPPLLQRALYLLLNEMLRRASPGARMRLLTWAQGGVAGLRLQVQPLPLDDSALSQLFEPFAQSEQVEAGPGAEVRHTGMGLAIVRSLLQRMQGQATAQRLLGFEGGGGGIQIELSLPAADETTATADGPSPPPRADRAPPCVLYIEDNPVNALIVKELVDRRGGLVLHVATDGATGLAAAREHAPALVLLDMHLPDMDGLSVLQALRADPRTAQTPCVAVSANAVPEDIRHALEAGFADYWTKPLDFRGFLASLDRWFGPPPRA
ncbi:PAS domain S-box [Burkholderiales bacterium JOSHI_001]|nr:PAS domain S-box [Burkholderiales bacterium JOSHI_001]